MHWDLIVRMFVWIDMGISTHCVCWEGLCSRHLFLTLLLIISTLLLGLVPVPCKHLYVYSSLFNNVNWPPPTRPPPKLVGPVPRKHNSCDSNLFNYVNCPPPFSRLMGPVPRKHNSCHSNLFHYVNSRPSSIHTHVYGCRIYWII